jgi:hypothetical protein
MALDGTRRYPARTSDDLLWTTGADYTCAARMRRVGTGVGMQEQSLDLARRTTLAALPWAAGFAAILTFTGIIPCCNFLVFPLGTAGLGYLAATRLGLSPAPETKQSLALTIGLTVGAIATVAAVIASLITQGISLGIVALLGLSSNRSSFDLLASSLGIGVSLVVGLLVTVIGGLIFGAIFGILGSYLALDRQRPRESYY